MLLKMISVGFKINLGMNLTDQILSKTNDH